MNALEKLVNFLTALDQHKVWYRLTHNRPDAITVETAIPGERWEIDFFPSGEIEVEIFGNSSGVKSAEINALLKRLTDSD